VKRLFQWTRETGIWAPVLVLVMHELLRYEGWRREIDWLNHYSGGLAFSFFAWKSLPKVAKMSGELTPVGRLGVAFLAGCTAALMWEIGEFSADLVLGTHIQKSIDETMMDIVNGFLGTVTTVVLAGTLYARSKRKAD